MVVTSSRVPFSGLPLLAMLCMAQLGSAAREARADAVWQFEHVAAGYGIADLNGGLPPEESSDQTMFAGELSMGFYASEHSQLSTMGASASIAGISHITINPFADELAVLIRLIPSYTPSFAPGGDRPGGFAEGSLSSIIEFVMPDDLVQWNYLLLVEDGPYFSGQTQSLVQNVSRQQTLLTFDDAVGFAEGHTLLPGRAGDLIRITTMISASGSVPPNVLTGFALYDGIIDMNFSIVPEPSTLLLAVLLAGLAARVRRRG